MSISDNYFVMLRRMVSLIRRWILPCANGFISNKNYGALVTDMEYDVFFRAPAELNIYTLSFVSKPMQPLAHTI